MISIIRADVLDVADVVAEHSVKCVVTSPPRWVGNSSTRTGFGTEPTVQEYVAHTKKAFQAIKQVLLPDGVVYWQLGGNDDAIMPARIEVMASEELGWSVGKRVVWLRKGSHQSILRMCPGGESFVFGDDVHDWPESDYQHPEFGTLPIELIEWAILAATQVFDTVLDPFAGSGTTGVAAGELARNCILIDRAYQDVQEERCRKWLDS